MSYVALYRKYRPQTFDEIVGQKAIVTTLKNQLKTGKIAHAYLFCGMRGTGKTSTARVFAKALNCEKGPAENPCNECDTCRAISNGSMIDVIEMDAASNRGIDDIRDLKEKVNFAPSQGRYKVYIIDEVHMLTTEAFNALLKTLEEPPDYVIFILATTEPDKLPSTILSRCMRFDFTRVSVNEIIGQLEKVTGDLDIKVEKRALSQIAAYSQGSVRDALSLLDKAAAFGKGEITYQDVLDLLGAVGNEVFYGISNAAVKADISAMLNAVDDISKQGKDIFRFTEGLLKHFRDLLMVSIDADRSLVDATDEDYARLKEISKEYTKEKILSIIDILNDAESEIKWSSQPRIIVEAALAKLVLPALWKKEEGHIARVQELEKKVAALEARLENVMTNTGSHVKKEPVSDIKNVTDSVNVADLSSKAEPIKADEPKKPEKKVKPLDKDETDDKEVLQTIQKSWPNILKTLTGKGKMKLISFIKAGEIKPAKIENKKLYFINEGDAVYEEMILAEKHTIEEMIKEIANIDITVKGFVQKGEDAPSDIKNFEPDKIEKGKKEISDEEYSQQVIDFFGEDNVTFED
ncbi:DNA polymerase III subunit gamma/tau [Tepidanaerobacter sp. EBM-49]|uniref:DNA polymerase III subunit gamma/tau n=1 Tax=Tepidanaerobacter sp. EBM-49 TaxID=1918504 RepID=UPI000AE505C6|nr:DNA polymerase III subunit gamma/tau [Tepidanaerobacter sp. EBM-49]